MMLKQKLKKYLDSSVQIEVFIHVSLHIVRLGENLQDIIEEC